LRAKDFLEYDNPYNIGMLAQPGPALLHVQVNPMQLVMPPFMQVEPAISIKSHAILGGLDHHYARA